MLDQEIDIVYFVQQLRVLKTFYAKAIASSKSKTTFEDSGKVIQLSLTSSDNDNN